jgi:hypothetical protein
MLESVVGCRPYGTLLHLTPGQKGTKQLLTQYGDRLVCVRYGYEAQRKKRFKTVELMVTERAWEPPPPRVAADTMVGERVGFAEVAMRDQVKQAGGQWNPSRKVWELRYDQVGALKLESRLVAANASESRYQGETPKHLYVEAQAVSASRCLHRVLEASI